MSHLMTKPTKWHVHPVKTQIGLGIQPVWSETSLSVWRKLGSLATHWPHSEDSDQTVRMPRLIRVFTGCTCHFVGFVMRRLNYIYSPRQGQTIHWGQNFDDNRKAFSLCPYVASFKMISSKSDFIHIFNDFIHVYSPGARAENPLGTTFDVNRKPLSLRPFVAGFKQISWILILYTFLMFLCIPFVDKILMSTEKPCHFAHLLQVSKKYLWSLILYIIFHVFIHVYSPGVGADNPLWSEFLYKHKPFVTLVICSKFLPLNDFLTVFPRIKA